jgi:serine/threonine protein kinase
VSGGNDDRQDPPDHDVRDVGSVIAGRYVLKAYLGTGRYGEVFEAVDRSLSDPLLQREEGVVLHLLHDRVAEETRLLQKLETSYQHPYTWSHPNIVKIRGFGNDRGRYFVVLERLDGATLRSIFDEASESPSESEALAVLREVGDALKYAHAKGAVHGDVRAEKIFVTSGHTVKVLDLLPGSSPRGAPFFVEDAPAHGGLQRPDQRDDVYGLASLAYEFFSGARPDDGRSPLDASQSSTALAPIRRLGTERWTALARGLALRREQRTPSVAAFLVELGVADHETASSTNGVEARDAAPPSARASPRRTQEDDMPIIGDYSGSWDMRRRATRAEPTLDAPAPAQRKLGEFDGYTDLARRRREPREPRQRAPRVAMIATAGVVLAALAIWNYPPLRGRAQEWLASGRPPADAAPDREPGEARPRIEGEETVVAPPIAVASPEPPAAETPEETADAASPEPPAAVESAAIEAEPAPADADAAGVTEAAPAAPPEPPPPPPPPAPETFEFVSRVVTVSEADALARIVIRRRGGDRSESAVIWWTSDGTARASSDYADLGELVEVFPAGEELRAVHVPLVGDSNPEPRESFYVNLRPSDESVEPPEPAEVVIVDND